MVWLADWQSVVCLGFFSLYTTLLILHVTAYREWSDVRVLITYDVRQAYTDGRDISYGFQNENNHMHLLRVTFKLMYLRN